jgi:hypothetical protein
MERVHRTEPRGAGIYSYADRDPANSGFLFVRIAAGGCVRLRVYIAAVDGNVLTGDKIAVGTG